MSLEKAKERKSTKIRFFHIIPDCLSRVSDMLSSPSYSNKIFKTYFEAYNDSKGQCKIFNKEFDAIFDNIFKVNLKNIVIEFNSLFRKSFYVAQINYPIFAEFKITNYYYTITIDNSTVHVITFEGENNESMRLLNNIYTSKMHENVMLSLDSLLPDFSEQLSQTESLIIDSNINDVWSIITDWSKFQHFDIKMPQLLKCSGSFVKSGTEMIVYLKENSNQLFKLKVFECKIIGRKRFYTLTCFCGDEMDELSTVIKFCLIEINKSKCFLENKHIYNFFVNSFVLEEIVVDKKRLLVNLKHYLESK